MKFLILIYFYISKGESFYFEPLLGLVESIVKPNTNELPDTLQTLTEYDFIIVGAGTAGCTLANRLTEIGNWKVLLLEAGGPEKFYMDVPILVNYLQFTQSNWKYKTEPSDSSCLGLINNQCNWPRGKVMGGSSVLNYMIYTRGNRRDYDRWQELGNAGWGWNDVLPYFKKVENFNIPEYQNPKYHGTEGPVNIGYVPFSTNVAKAWIKSAQEAGHKLNDYNGQTQTGTSLFQVNMKNGTRVSSNQAYLYPIKNRLNLHVIKNSLVTKLLTDGRNKITGVEFAHSGWYHKVYAKKEVILSAGTINSAQLLLLSGIGPREDLEKLGIPVIRDLKVGHNLMDHVSTGGIIFTLDRQNFSLNTASILSNVSTIFEYINRGAGPLTVPGGGEAMTFVDLDNPWSQDGWPDMEIIFAGATLNADPSAKLAVGIKDDIYAQVFESLGDRQGFMVFPTILRPKSRGVIKLKNTNPTNQPLIYANYLTDERDMNTLIRGIKEAIRIGMQPTLQQLGTNLYKVPVPNCKHLVYGTDPYWTCLAKHLTLTFYHPSGTCKMGPASDATAVVSPRLKVHGVEGIRVIDASIIPEIPAAHTNAPVFMIAEKGADLIKQDWGYNYNQ